jgi:3-hydroxyisobutyrate dehydrogenase-like beta-hydroxyacid dehydrogenase
MTKVGFIGLGIMGLPMAQNLINAGYAVSGMDVSNVQKNKLAAAGGTAAMTSRRRCRAPMWWLRCSRTFSMCARSMSGAME